jgi:hypothetical protein
MSPSNAYLIRPVHIRYDGLDHRSHYYGRTSQQQICGCISNKRNAYRYPSQLHNTPLSPYDPIHDPIFNQYQHTTDMQFTLPPALLASFRIGADACAWYFNCKCHDSKTGLQDDAVTKSACEIYGRGATDSDTKQIYGDVTVIYGGHDRGARTMVSLRPLLLSFRATC